MGFEPTACCLRNFGALFHSVPVCSVRPNLPCILRWWRFLSSRSVLLRPPRLLAVLLGEDGGQEHSAHFPKGDDNCRWCGHLQTGEG